MFGEGLRGRRGRRANSVKYPQLDARPTGTLFPCKFCLLSLRSPSPLPGFPLTHSCLLFQPPVCLFSPSRYRDSRRAREERPLSSHPLVLPAILSSFAPVTSREKRSATHVCTLSPLPPPSPYLLVCTYTHLPPVSSSSPLAPGGGCFAPRRRNPGSLSAPIPSSRTRTLCTRTCNERFRRIPSNLL